MNLFGVGGGRAMGGCASYTDRLQPAWESARQRWKCLHRMRRHTLHAQPAGRAQGLEPGDNRAAEGDAALPPSEEMLGLGKRRHDNASGRRRLQLQRRDSQGLMPASRSRACNAALTANSSSNNARASADHLRLNVGAECDAGRRRALGHAAAITRHHWQTHEEARSGQLIEGGGSSAEAGRE
jgi:hypothetical protein